MTRRSGLITIMALAALSLVGLVASADRTTANFTATTTNPSNTFQTATISLSNDKSTAGALVNITNMVPGDTATRTVTITNTGNASFTYNFVASQTNNTLLWSDAVNGLQVSVSKGATNLYTGALKNMGTLTTGTTVAALGTETITYVFSLPTSAGNTFQTLTQDLTITYTATQLAGTAR